MPKILMKNPLSPLNLQAFYDTIEIPTGRDLYSESFWFFENLRGKDYDMTNAPQTERIPNGWCMTIGKIWVAVLRPIVLTDDAFETMICFPDNSIFTFELWRDDIKTWGRTDKLANWDYGLIPEYVEIIDEPRKSINARVCQVYNLSIDLEYTVKAYLTFPDNYQLDIPLKCRLWLHGSIVETTA